MGEPVIREALELGLQAWRATEVRAKFHAAFKALDRLERENTAEAAYRSVLTLREARRLVRACEDHEVGPDELVEIWRGESGALNAECLLMRVQVSGADERFEVVE